MLITIPTIEKDFKGKFEVNIKSTGKKLIKFQIQLLDKDSVQKVDKVTTLISFASSSHD